MSEMGFVFALIGVAAALMASNRVRFDIVALLVVLALMLSGVLTIGEALAGFGSPVVIIVASLLVVGEMLERTGVARALGDLILKHGGTNETRIMILIMAAVALVGSVMSSTAIVAIFIPIVIRVASETNGSVQRLLLPMSYTALISGMLTLIATTPNLVVSEELKAAGVEGLGFFTITPIGVAVLVVGVTYLVVARRLILPGQAATDAPAEARRGIDDLLADFDAADRIAVIRIDTGSSLSGRTIEEAALESTFGIRVIGLQRSRRTGDERIAAPAGATTLQAGDSLLVAGDPEALSRFAGNPGLDRVMVSNRDRQRWLWEKGGVRVLIHPESRLIGKSIRDAQFRSTYGLHVLGVRHASSAVHDFEDARLKAGDSLLVVGTWSNIDRLQTRTHDLVVTELPRERTEVVKAYRKMPIALVILGTMVLLVLFDVVPLVAAALLAVLAAVFTRCLSMEDAYRAIPWSSIVLVAGMLPLADALDRTGGIDAVTDIMLGVVGDAGPRVMLTAVFFLTATLGLFLSNTASAVLCAPIAIHAAKSLDVSPYPFAIAVAIAASAAFVIPVSTPVVTLVVEPGRYRFVDFVKAGVPLLILTWLVTLLLAPIVLPFEPFEWPQTPATLTTD